MSNKRNYKQTLLVPVCLTLLFSLLLFPNLGVRTLWQDEAETALVSQQMVRSNVWLPYAYDDEGPISQDWSYQFSVSPLWRWHPWLQFYTTAISFKFLGISAFSARLPFVLIGILSYIYYLYFLKKYGPKSQTFFFIASIMLLVSAPLLLHIRQSRYYALSVFFTLMTIDGYLDLQRIILGVRQGLSLKHSYKYIFGSIFLFHSFLPGALMLQVSFWIHQLGCFLRSDLGVRQGRTFKQFSFAFVTTLLFTLPWSIWLKIRGQNINLSFELIKQHFHQHYIYIHKFIFPFFLFIPLLFPRLRKKFFQDEVVSLFSISISISILLYTINHPYFFRYLVPLIPLFSYTAAWIFIYSSNVVRLLYILVFLHMTLRTFPGYLYEITHVYHGTNERLVQFINSLDQERYQRLAVNYDDFTFRFHTGIRVIGPQEFQQSFRCPNIVIIFPDWGNEAYLRALASACKLTAIDTPMRYEKLAGDPDPISHKFSDQQLTRTFEVFLSPSSPN